MKFGVLYILIFVFLFIGVTAVILTANEKYENIFKFNFSPKKNEIVSDSTKIDSLSVLKDSTILDDLKLDSLKKARFTDSLTASAKTVSSTNDSVSAKEEMQQALSIKKDSAYLKWKQETIKLYESMDSKKVAKIIENLSDDIARDLIYSMKKKKAAEILSSVSSELAIRLTRAK